MERVNNVMEGVMEERRRENDKNWEEIKNFIQESRDYRSRDEVTQKFQVENLETLKNAVKLQNGRVLKLEEWKQIIEQKIQQHKDNYNSIQALITVIATIVMAVSAMVMIFKK
jgi:hypothetical protein